MPSPFFEFIGNPEALQRTLEHFVAASTGLPLDRVARVLKLGEPWPDDKIFERDISLAQEVAETQNIKLETAIAAVTSMLAADGNPLSLEEITQHLDQTANLAGEEREVVRSVVLAMGEFHRLFGARLKEAIEKMGQGHNDSQSEKGKED